MKYFWSWKSKRVRNKLHPYGKLLVDKVLEEFDVSLVESLRNKKKQDSNYAKGFSWVKFPFSKHNYSRDPQLKTIKWLISDAWDMVPADTGWDSEERLNEIAAYVLVWAKIYGIDVTWGGTFERYDGAHFQINFPKK